MLGLFLIALLHGFRRRDGDDEDIDAMIANLKKKTTGRDMYDVVRNIDKPSNFDDY